MTDTPAEGAPTEQADPGAHRALTQIIIQRHLPDWYRQFARPVRRALAQQRLHLTDFIEDAGIYRSVHEVKRRLKTEASVGEALLKGRRRDITEFRDFGGLRVVVHSRQDVRVIARFLKRQEEVGDITIASDEEIRRENG